MNFTHSEQIKEIFLQAAGAEDFDPRQAAMDVLQKCLRLSEQSSQGGQTDMKADQRTLLEQQIKSLVFAIGCEADESNQLLLEYRSESSKDHPFVPRLLDMVLCLGDSNYLEPGFIFMLIERLVEITMVAAECHRLIDWILGNKDKLQRNHIFDRGKLILLRTVNRMLKILHRGEDYAYHSGRLLFFMSEIYPMAERSATNHSGLRDTSHPVRLVQFDKSVGDDFGRPVSESDYDLFWKTMDCVQSASGQESEVQSALRLVHQLLDYFKSHPCRRDSTPYLTRTPIALVNNTAPEQFNDMIRDPDCRMECIIQIYAFVQKLLCPSKNSPPISDSIKQRLQSALADIEGYAQGDPELKQRWEPVHGFLLRESRWIEWKNEGAADWTVRSEREHPWAARFCSEGDDADISDLVASCLNGSVDAKAEESSLDGGEGIMKAAAGLEGQFDRDLRLPDFDELRVPTAEEFLETALDDEEMESSMEILESDTSFCWRTYRLLSEHDIQYMVNGEHRTNFAKLLRDCKTRFGK